MTEKEKKKKDWSWSILEVGLKQEALFKDVVVAAQQRVKLKFPIGS